MRELYEVGEMIHEMRTNLVYDTFEGMREFNDAQKDYRLLTEIMFRAYDSRALPFRYWLCSMIKESEKDSSQREFLVRIYNFLCPPNEKDDEEDGDIGIEQPGYMEETVEPPFEEEMGVPADLTNRQRFWNLRPAEESTRFLRVRAIGE